ncbi:MAG: hypothetical protein HZB27_07870 [Meiothermus silvanus]|nr:hypothetical protein [Allomeiothermus silvanus]
MKRWLAVLVLATLVCSMWASAAPIATVYDQLSGSLAQVQSLQSSNPAQALTLLNDAQNRFRNSASDLASQLSDGILRNLEDAKVAIQRRSRTDLEARILVIRGILGKALYDAYFTAVAAKQGPQAQELLRRLVAASGLPATLSEQATALANAANLNGLRLLFERTYAQNMLTAIARARNQASPQAAYLDTTRAYALYLVVQDSPRASGLSAQDFVGALAKLSANQMDDFRAQAQALNQKIQAFLQQIGSRPSDQPRQTATPPANGGVAAQSPTPNSAAQAPTAPPSKPQPAPIQPVPVVPAQPSASAEDAYQRLLGDVRFLVSDPAKAERVTEQLTGAGILSVDDWKRAVLEVKGQAITAQSQVQIGRFDQARQTLRQLQSQYRSQVEPIVAALNPTLAERTNRLISAMQQAVGLRTTDFSVLSNELEESRLALSKQSLGFGHDFQVSLQLLLLGLPRAVLFILAGMLAVIPLYLLALTFGGRNIYWRFLGLAFFFLLLPAMLEGLSYIGSILADYGNLPFFGTLASLSIQQSLTAQMFWALTLFLVIVFAGIGLRGIATQFGLLQNTRTPLGQQASVTMSRADPKMTTETLVEWDEEF